MQIHVARPFRAGALKQVRRPDPGRRPGLTQDRPFGAQKSNLQTQTANGLRQPKNGLRVTAWTRHSSRLGGSLPYRVTAQ